MKQLNYRQPIPIFNKWNSNDENSKTKHAMLPSAIKTLVTFAILFLTVINGSYAQDDSLKGTIAFCHSSTEKSIQPSAANLRSVAQNTTILNTDFVSAGVGGMRDIGTGQIILSGLSGTVTRAYLYWHGVTNIATNVGGTIMVNSTFITGTNIGVSDNNCWGYNNSQAYRADVTSLVTSAGNGTYNLSNFGSLNPNGASLIVFFNDGDSTNNRDVVIFDGNDSNIFFAGITGNPNAPADPAGWNVLLSGINYNTGIANIQLHVADGQLALDDALKINNLQLVAAGPVFQGNTVPGPVVGASGGNLWDIRSFNVTPFLTPGPNSLNLTTGQNSDCLGLIVALVDLPAGAAPLSVYYSKPTGDLHNVLTWGLNMDGSGPNPPDFGAAKTFMLANRVVDYTLTGNWTVGGILNIPNASQLKINGFTLSVADVNGGGSFSGTTVSNLILTTPSFGGTSLNFLSTGNNLGNLTITSGATTTLASALNIYGVLTEQDGTFNTANLLTLKSTATNTARVAPVTGSISGTVTVERYIPARRAWRIMSAPVGGSQTINQAWQEGVTTSSANPNPVPGYGTHITEGSPVNGFDHNPLIAMISIKRYVSATDSWNPLSNTNATTVNSDTYLLFVRGDRGIPLGLNTVPPITTTLRATGPLKVGNQTFPVSASGFTAIPNPFASPINFATLTKTNVQNNFYLWDPKMGGTDGVGGYVLLSFNGTSYDITPAAVSPESQYIQSGQGFLVHSTGTAGSLVIKESDKSATPAMDVFRVASTSASGNANPFNVNVSTKSAGLRINLQSVNADNTTSLLDEVFSSYGTNFSDKVDELDAQKLANVEENLAIARGNHNLMIDRSAALDETDTIQLKLWNTVAGKRYAVEFNSVNLSTTVSTAYLLDNYLKTSTPVSLNKIFRFYFNVTPDAASTSSNRFTVVFKAASDQGMANNKNGIITYPNPVTGKTIQLMFNDQPQGTYKVELVNGLGQTIYTNQINHGGGSAIQKLELVSKPVTGIYLLNITNSNRRNAVKVVIK